jgi:Fe-S cluster biosynthesis and repair protein YggX
MSDDFPTLSEVGEANIREREKRALAEWEEHQRFLANEYERL